jgi:hypothetical protein
LRRTKSEFSRNAHSSIGLTVDTVGTIAAANGLAISVEAGSIGSSLRERVSMSIFFEVLRVLR